MFMPDKIMAVTYDYIFGYCCFFANDDWFEAINSSATFKLTTIEVEFSAIVNNDEATQENGGAIIERKTGLFVWVKIQILGVRNVPSVSQ